MMMLLPQLARALFDHGPARTYGRFMWFLAAEVEADRREQARQ